MAGFYTYNIDGTTLTVWQEGEGPDQGKWFFATDQGFSDSSEPYATKREAKESGIRALTENKITWKLDKELPWAPEWVGTLNGNVVATARVKGSPGYWNHYSGTIYGHSAAQPTLAEFKREAQDAADARAAKKAEKKKEN